jgi:hypothetical protein
VDESPISFFLVGPSPLIYQNVVATFMPTHADTTAHADQYSSLFFKVAAAVVYTLIILYISETTILCNSYSAAVCGGIVTEYHRSVVAAIVRARSTSDIPIVFANV